MVYSIEYNGDVQIVFGQAFRVPTGQYTPIILDIFGDAVSMYEAINESGNNIDRDSNITGTCCQIKRNMELGMDIIAKWREYVIRKSDELNITGQGLVQLNAFSGIALALTTGCLAEASLLIPSMSEDDVITAEIKQKFINACNSADHI
jgi:hypothetical protein